MTLYELRKNPIDRDEGDSILSVVELQLELGEAEGTFATIASLLETIGIYRMARSTQELWLAIRRENESEKWTMRARRPTPSVSHYRETANLKYFSPARTEYDRRC